MVIDDAVNRNLSAESMPAGTWLAVHHHDGIASCQRDFVDEDEIDVEQIDHGLVLGPADLRRPG